MDTTSKQLPPELLSLVHHIELHRSGWWDKALQQLILYVLWLNEGFMTGEQVGLSIKNTFGISVEPERLDPQLEELKEASKTIRSSGSSYKITEEQVASLELDLGAAQDIEQQVRRLFTEEVSAVCPEIDPNECWNEFNQRCLIPLVLEMGARTYGFFSDRSRPRELTFEDTEFFAIYGPERGEILRRLAVDFIAPDNPLIRDYVLRTLDAAFFVEATGLRRDVLEKLSSSTGGHKSLRLFLDTNLLFSVLDLHDNPSNRSVKSLLNLVGEVDPTVNCTLYVLPNTIEEFRRVIWANLDDLKRITLPRNVAAAVRGSGKLSGIKMRYVDACEKVGKHIDPDDFFRPYASNTVTVIRNNGVELYNAKLEEYGTRQDVVDGINDLWESEDAEYRTDGRYRALEHDMVLLSFVADQRPAHIDSPLEAKSWFLTIDYRLLRYDRKKNAGSPVCIHPSLLIQMLQFWLPRTQAFETAMIESLRIPFASRGFDAASERVALRILEVLSRFEVGDLSAEVITQVLVNDAIHTAFKRAEDEDAEISIVKEGLLSLDAELRSKLERVEQETAEFRSVVAQQSKQIGELQEELRQGSATVQELQEELRTARYSHSHSNEEILELKAKLSESETEGAATQRSVHYLLKWIFLPSVIVFLLTTGTALVASSIQVASPSMMTTLVAVVGLAVVLGLAERQGTRVDGVRRMAWYIGLRRWRRWVYGALGTILLGMASRYIWQFLN